MKTPTLNPETENIMEIIERHGENTSESGIYWYEPEPEPLKKELSNFIAKVEQRAEERERERIYNNMESIINAHLWGDYSFDGREMWSNANRYLDKLKKSLTPPTTNERKK